LHKTIFDFASKVDKIIYLNHTPESKNQKLMKVDKLCILH